MPCMEGVVVRPPALPVSPGDGANKSSSVKVECHKLAADLNVRLYILHSSTCAGFFFSRDTRRNRWTEQEGIVFVFRCLILSGSVAVCAVHKAFTNL